MMTGQKISQYEILEKLGEGGMGVVYRAHDTKLDRIVALKFLPHALTANDDDRARFLQEARAAAALNHPHACGVYDIQETDGQQYIVMEFVEGATLRKKIEEATKSGKTGLAAQEAVNYAVQIGEALAEAHSKNIVHRDVKSENIMVNAKNQVKVMDFGLAKLKGTLKLTRSSSTVGTLAYMAPEQIQGGEVDARSDIFSFGIVLFEMLTGKTPFRGEHDAAMMYSIVNEEPEAVEKHLPDLSPEYGRIIGRMLEKDPEDRYQSVADIVSELRREQKKSGRVVRPAEAGGAHSDVRPARAIPPAGKTTGVHVTRWVIAGAVVLVAAVVSFFLFRGSPEQSTASASGRKMLVVIPFQNLGASEQDYFADGITEEITSKLSGLSGLGVIAQSSAMQYRKTTKTIKQIGEELGVNYVLQGTIRWETGNGTSRVRVTPQLINVADGTQLWSQPSEAVVASAFQIQSDIASQVAQALDVTLVRNEQQALSAKPTENPEAYDAYLRGSGYEQRGIGERNYQLAEQMYEKAIELDPNFLLAHARLAALHSHIYWEQFDHTDERILKSKTEAEMALRLDPNAPDAHGAMGWYYYHCLRDYDKALKEFDVALTAQPNNTNLLLGIAAISRRVGKWDDALRYFKRITEIDPRSGSSFNDLGFTSTYVRDYPEALASYDRSIALTPEYVINYEAKAMVEILWKGDTVAARVIMENALKQKAGLDDPAFAYYYATIQLYAGHPQAAVQTLEEMSPEVINGQFWYYPKELLFAPLYATMQQSGKARSAYDAARKVIEAAMQKHPDDSRLHGALGIAYAGLGRKDDAIREGRKGVELMPIAVDAGIGPERVRELAQIYTMVGEPNAAVDQLTILMHGQTLFSAQMLKLDPTWNPLRNNTRFQQLLAVRQ